MKSFKLCLSQPDRRWLGRTSSGIMHTVAVIIRVASEGEAQTHEVQYVGLNHPNIKGTQICCLATWSGSMWSYAAEIRR